ncbi:hypothetical protein Vretimale_2663 [Volvox reticuliferus]|uniref:Uncharacterized protein n=1 Tax=Volvox reticuliferus TaxID=1737510 RepID=A0A8J4D796_9CHLO|nr:hypothetical protein Vretimale_2663 [Volvox reticuliferus]
MQAVAAMKRGMHEQGMAQQSEPAKRPRWPLSSHGLSAGDCQTSTFKFGVVSGCTSSTHPDEGPGNAAVSSCAAGNTTADNNEPGDVLHVATSPPGRLTRGMARELAHARGHSSMDNGLQEKAHATGAAAPGGQRWTRGYCKKYRARTVGPAAADMPVATAEAEAAPEDSLGSSALKKADDVGCRMNEPVYYCQLMICSVAVVLMMLLDLCGSEALEGLGMVRKYVSVAKLYI